MLESMFNKWSELCQVAATGVLVPVNRVLNARIVMLNSQVKSLVGKLAEAENHLQTFDALVATLNGAIKDLQVDNEKLRASSGPLSDERAHDQEIQIGDLRRTVRELEEKCQELSLRRRAGKSEHSLAENVKNNFSACGSMRVKLATQEGVGSYNLGPLSIPADVLLEWYMRRLSDAMAGNPMPEPYMALKVSEEA